MSVKQINLDTLIDNVKKVEIRIAGKVYSIDIDDGMFKKLTVLQADVGAYFSKLEEISDKEFVDMGENGRQEFVDKMFAELKNKLIIVLDELLGEGEGNRLYSKLGNKVSALSFLVGQLRDIYLDSISKKQEKEQEQVNRMNKYVKPRRKNRKWYKWLAWPKN